MNTIIKKKNLHTGNVSKFYTAKARYNDKNFNITYDCKTENILIHEWYKFNKEQLTEVTEDLKRYFNNKVA